MWKIARAVSIGKSMHQGKATYNFFEIMFLPRSKLTCVKLATASKSYTLLWDFEANVGWPNPKLVPGASYIYVIVLVRRVPANTISAPSRTHRRPLTSSKTHQESPIRHMLRTFWGYFRPMSAAQKQTSYPPYCTSILSTSFPEYQPTLFPLSVGHAGDCWRHQTYG